MSRRLGTLYGSELEVRVRMLEEEDEEGDVQ
jgi:hypothetical protein